MCSKREIRRDGVRPLDGMGKWVCSMICYTSIPFGCLFFEGLAHMYIYIYICIYIYMNSINIYTYMVPTFVLLWAVQQPNLGKLATKRAPSQLTRNSFDHGIYI